LLSPFLGGLYGPVASKKERKSCETVPGFPSFCQTGGKPPVLRNPTRSAGTAATCKTFFDVTRSGEPPVPRMTRLPAASTEDVTLLVLADGARGLPPDLATKVGSHVVVASPSRTLLAVAQMSLPEAAIVWTNLNNSASLRSLRRTVMARGEVGRLVILGGTEATAAGFAEMETLLNLLPAMRRSPPAEIVIRPNSLEATQSLQTFVDCFTPHLQDQGLALSVDRPDNLLPAR
jgi:hypothetical protein